MAELLLVVVPQRPRLTSAQFQTVVNICVEIGVIGFGSIVLPAILDKIVDPVLLLFGLTATATFWFLAVWVAKKIS